MKRIAIFGSTGSIGTTTLQVIRENKACFDVVTLVAGHNVSLLLEQMTEFHPRQVYVIDEGDAKRVQEAFPEVKVYYGEQGMEEISSLADYDIAVSALVGIAGLRPTYNMIKQGKTIALANKEVLVAGGRLMMDAVEKYGATLLPVDSEHSAIFQCLQGEKTNAIDRILLTASGGPFWNKEIPENVTVEEALCHPTWKMGPKVTVDSATMMNKGFEVIEASLLFKVEASKIQVVVHKESLIHSMVEFQDGTILANIAPKSMQLPIAYSLFYPKRVANAIPKLDLFAVASLTLEAPLPTKFPCLQLAYEALEKGPYATVILNAANEALVAAFLDKRIQYREIAAGIAKQLDEAVVEELSTIDDILSLDQKIKERTEEWISNRKTG